MAFYRFVELAEHVFRDVPKSETRVLLVATSKEGRLDSYLLQRGSFEGDVWWETPDGESVFNRLRVVGHDTEAVVYDTNDDDNSYSATAHTLAAPFSGADRFIVAGSWGCASDKGSNYIVAYEWTTDEEQDAFPDNEDTGNMLQRVSPTPEEIKSVSPIIHKLEATETKTAAA